MVKVYFASMMKHAAKCRILCLETPCFAHARWLRHDYAKTESTAENLAKSWLETEEDIKSADAMIVYAEPDDHLRSALVEAGIAICSGVPVIVVGNHRDYGKWQFHPNVRRVLSLDDAIVAAIQMASSKRPK